MSQSGPNPEDSRTLSVFPGRRLALFFLLFLLLSGLGIYVVYAQVAGHEVAWDSRLLSPELLASSVLLLVVYFAADGLRLWFTLRALGESVSFASMLQLIFLNTFVSNITPLATGGGIAQVWYMQRRGVPVGTGMTATTIRTALAALFIFGATPVLLLTLPGAEETARNQSLVVTLVVSVAVYIGFFFVLTLRTRWLLRTVLGALKLVHHLRLMAPERHSRWRRNIARELHRFAAGFRRYLQGRLTDIAGSFLFTALFLLTLFSFPALLFWALGYGFDYWLVIGRMVMTTFVMYFSPTPGASGIAEGVFGHFFADVVTASHLVLVTLAWRALTIWLGMLIGVFILQRELTATIEERTA